MNELFPYRSANMLFYNEIFEKELPCGAMRDFAEWCRCKASETDGEGSVLKYMTQARESKATQQMRCYANVLQWKTSPKDVRRNVFQS